MKKSGHDIFKILVYFFLTASLATYFVPAFKVEVPPFGRVSWSVHSVVKMIPKGMFNQNQKSAAEIQFNFLDMLRKILPEKKQQSFSPAFLIGALIPVALLFAYITVFFNFFLVHVNKLDTLITSAAISLAASIYALLATYYLSAQARLAFQNALNKASEGLFGIIAKSFVSKNIVEPDSGFYMLVAFTFLSLIAAIYKKHA